MTVLCDIAQRKISLDTAGYFFPGQTIVVETDFIVTLHVSVSCGKMYE